uniref:Putative secreted protein n=1 Tax=Ixodes ricinus TaxID=34613 RepID=A0A6B0UNJ8_IXORI
MSTFCFCCLSLSCCLAHFWESFRLSLKQEPQFGCTVRTSHLVLLLSFSGVPAHAFGQPEHTFSWCILARSSANCRTVETALQDFATRPRELTVTDMSFPTITHFSTRSTFSSAFSSKKAT